MADDVMTIPEFAKRIRVKPRTAYDIVARRLVDVIDVSTGGRPSLRITEDAYAAFLKSRKVRGSAA